MQTHGSIQINLGYSNLNSFLMVYLVALKNRKFGQLKVLFKPKNIIFLMLICLIYSVLLVWIKLTGKLFCPCCQSTSISPKQNYYRKPQLLTSQLKIAWFVKRYRCNYCKNKSFNIFSNTFLKYSRLHPSLFILSKIRSYRFVRLFSSFFAMKIRSYRSSSIKLDWSLISISYVLAEMKAKLEQLDDKQQQVIDSLRFFIQHCLNEKQKRIFAGWLSLLFKTTAIKKTQQLTRLSAKTIRAGKQSLLKQDPKLGKDQGIRQKGAGRKAKIRDPLRQEQLLKLLEPETAGDPISGLKWTGKTLRSIGKVVGLAPTTVSAMLRLLDFSPRVNSKKKSSKSNHPDRDKQFRFISAQIKDFLAQGVPVLSVDCKKKEQIGNFKNKGKSWVKEPYEVYDHDFANLSEGNLLPFGIYDLHRNTGYVVCGTSRATTEFAVDALVLWWEKQGYSLIKDQKEICLLFDAGPPNSYRSVLFHWYVQIKLADVYGLKVHIRHYPPGTSKYNKIEHRLFCHISNNWAGVPLISYELALNYIKNTKTEGGLSVEAILLEGDYSSKQKVEEKDMVTINLTREEICGDWNYTIEPRNEVETKSRLMKYEEEQIIKGIWHLENKVLKSKYLVKKQVNKYLAENCWEFYQLKFEKYQIHYKNPAGVRGRLPKGRKKRKFYSARLKYQIKSEINKDLTI